MILSPVEPDELGAIYQDASGDRRFLFPFSFICHCLPRLAYDETVRPSAVGIPSVLVEHKPLCDEFVDPHATDWMDREDAVTKAARFLKYAMNPNEDITKDQVKDILTLFSGYRNLAMRQLIDSGVVVRVGNKFRRIR